MGISTAFAQPEFSGVRLLPGPEGSFPDIGLSEYGFCSKNRVCQIGLVRGIEIPEKGDDLCWSGGEAEVKRRWSGGEAEVERR